MKIEFSGKKQYKTIREQRIDVCDLLQLQCSIVKLKSQYSPEGGNHRRRIIIDVYHNKFFVKESDMHKYTDKVRFFQLPSPSNDLFMFSRNEFKENQFSCVITV